MMVNSLNYDKPKVFIMERKDLGLYYTETRCYICKSFVAIDK